MKRLVASLLLVLAQVAAADTLTIAVAASAQYAFADLAKAFHRHSGHTIKPIYNSSGKLTAQIMHGAPIDAFLSADMAFPEKLHREGHTATAPEPYALGALVLWTLHDLDLTEWPALLTSNRVRRIALANPKLAPYGHETMNVLTYVGLADALRPKLVFGESIAQVNQYTHSRAVDAGFTAKSVVLAPAMRGKGRWVELPADAYQPIAQGFVILKHGERNKPDAVRGFRTFLLSPPARAILARYGYLQP